MKRLEILENCPEGFETELGSIVDDIEDKVNSAKDLLLAIKGVDDLTKVDECLYELDKLSLDLY